MSGTWSHQEKRLPPEIEEAYEAFLRFANEAIRKNILSPPLVSGTHLHWGHRFSNLVDVLQSSFTEDPRDTFARLKFVEHKLGQEFDVDRVFFLVLLQTELSHRYHHAMEIEDRFSTAVMPLIHAPIKQIGERDILMGARHALFFYWQATHVTDPLAATLSGFPGAPPSLGDLMSSDIIRSFGSEHLFLKPKEPRRVTLLGGWGAEPSEEDPDTLLAAVATERLRVQEIVTRVALDVLSYQMESAAAQHRALMTEITAFETDLKNWKAWVHSFLSELQNRGVQ